MTALLQSSTATALLTTSFAKRGMITLSASLAVMIGADISTTLVAQILSFDLSWLSPMLLVVGIVGYLFNEENSQRREGFSILIGLGFMLLSLAMVREASVPLKESELLATLLSALSSDPIFAVIMAAIVTYVIHSSLATVLLFASLAAGGIISTELGVLLVLGANIGGAMVPFITTYKEGAIARQITMGNIVMRLAMLLLSIPLMGYILEYLPLWSDDSARQIVNFHTGFNVALGLVFMPLVGLVADLSSKIFPETPEDNQAMSPQYLDEKDLGSPVVALANAARETLRLAELVEEMFEETMRAFKENHAHLIDKIREKDDIVDALHKATKLYLMKISQSGLDEKEADRYIQILTYSTNLEHIGDIIDRSLMDLALKKAENKYYFSEEGWQEIRMFHAQVLDNMRMAQTIFMSADHNLANEMVERKARIRQAASDTTEQHFKRLREGSQEALETSGLHMDIIRDYRRINSHSTRVAYAILEGRNKEQTI